jgi:hypothetical protein
LGRFNQRDSGDRTLPSRRQPWDAVIPFGYAAETCMNE